ncbi:hypothetical protein ADEAN_000979600 [Angomonas deanei]|uniref:Uncharacterized protein n=1 Tax=Angomonas deanei TaxID=59799 RepID=A0A7G2CR05_9TRYP|nr:hypothetical protein ADEAN_000979600 [Angomonas deanei]
MTTIRNNCILTSATNSNESSSHNMHFVNTERGNNDSNQTTKTILQGFSAVRGGNVSLSSSDNSSGRELAYADSSDGVLSDDGSDVEVGMNPLFFKILQAQKSRQAVDHFTTLHSSLPGKLGAIPTRSRPRQSDSVPSVKALPLTSINRRQTSNSFDITGVSAISPTEDSSFCCLRTISRETEVLHDSPTGAPYRTTVIEVEELTSGVQRILPSLPQVENYERTAAARLVTPSLVESRGNGRPRGRPQPKFSIPVTPPQAFFTSPNPKSSDPLSEEAPPPRSPTDVSPVRCLSPNGNVCGSSLTVTNTKTNSIINPAALSGNPIVPSRNASPSASTNPNPSSSSGVRVMRVEELLSPNEARRPREVFQGSFSSNPSSTGSSMKSWETLNRSGPSSSFLCFSDEGGAAPSPPLLTRPAVPAPPLVQVGELEPEDSSYRPTTHLTVVGGGGGGGRSPLDLPIGATQEVFLTPKPALRRDDSKSSLTSLINVLDGCNHQDPLADTSTGPTSWHSSFNSSFSSNLSVQGGKFNVGGVAVPLVYAGAPSADGPANRSCEEEDGEETEVGSISGEFKKSTSSNPLLNDDD